MLFIDTGAFLARYLVRDAHHRRVLSIWRQLPGQPLFTSSHVLAETFTLLGRRASYAFAAERAEEICASEAFQILRSAAEDERAAIGLFRKFADQRASFTDCLSFVLMKRYRLRTAFTLDRHFLDAGFEVIGPPAYSRNSTR